MSPLVEDFHTESMLIGDVTWTTSMLVCAQCQLHAKERLRAHQFHGIQTKNSMLVIPNRYDPVTSGNAARNASAASPGSPIVVNEGHGATPYTLLMLVKEGITFTDVSLHIARPLSEPTLCTNKAIRAYFTDGIPPGKAETFCASKAPAFVPQTLEEVLIPLDGENNS
ncbi:hypothetical protein LTR37_021509 [Vermiconidia calcicola]|uniref:Uncharacterized protein n=1 Tax=Vermiconidia calcicola TaxID=1690605 RepID=A0ACC3M9K0_9PEZI|nr:hypothetical protein LTR37_021509 [Vermiconidia calcicola]